MSTGTPPITGWRCRMRCDLCGYSERLPGAARECRRYPPVFRGAESQAWPKVRPGDWCGEFAALNPQKDRRAVEDRA